MSANAGDRRGDRRIAVFKDLTLFLGGLTGIGYQQITGDVNTVLLIIFTAMTGVPGLTNLISLFRGLPTESPSSRRVSEPSSLESDSAQ